jgi:hypothetical protein
MTRLLSCLSLACAACGGDDVDEAGAQRLWDKIQAESYRTWQRAPGWETSQPTARAHGDTADIFINATLAGALDETGLGAWPADSLIVKDSFKGQNPSLIAALEKQSGGWFYAEWTASGDVKYAGRPDVCLDCHRAGDDELLSLALP